MAKVKINGKVVDTWTDKDKLICPYCGTEIKVDCEAFAGDLETYVTFECGECGKEFCGSRDVTFIYETFKIDDNNKIMWADEV